MNLLTTVSTCCGLVVTSFAFVCNLFCFWFTMRGASGSLSGTYGRREALRHT